MMGTAASKLFGLSMAACPPRLKMPTLYPVFPRLRVGMDASVLEFAGRAGSVAAARAGIVTWVRRPAAMAPLVLRKFRRSTEEEDREEKDSFMAGTSDA